MLEADSFLLSAIMKIYESIQITSCTLRIKHSGQISCFHQVINNEDKQVSYMTAKLC